jgi:hypothetical protein
MIIHLETTTERLENIGGLLVAGKIGQAIGLSDLISKRPTTSLAITSLFGLLVQGRSAFEDIALFRQSELFRDILELPRVYAPETIRLYLEELARDKTMLPQVKAANARLLAKTDVSPIDLNGRHYIPVDVDVSPLDNSRSHKEGVSRTYKGCDGYAPIFSYIGTEGYMLDCELRPGSQHCQKDTPAFLKHNLETIAGLKLKHPVLFRLDGGNDSFDTIQPLAESGHFFLIKRNMRRENPLWLADIARAIGQRSDPRPGKIQWTGVLTKGHPKAPQGFPDLDLVFQVTERTCDHDGNAFLFPEIEVESWWTNLYEQATDIIQLYHDHGTSEQFHSELKSDMGVERLPSGKMVVNALFLTVAMVAFNTLRFMGQTAQAQSDLLPVKPEAKRKRLRKVISDLIYIACKYVSHAGQRTVKIWNLHPWLRVFQSLSATVSTM